MRKLKTAWYGIGTIALLFLMVLGLGWLVCSGVVALVFWLFALGGIEISFSPWIGGAILYIVLMILRPWK